MLFSVIVPVYNVEKYLPRCLDSLAGQTCADKEVILVDDGSTDSSGALCDEYASRYGFITTIHQRHQGASAARNTGLAAARGEWLSFVDGDDWVDTDMLELLQGCILATRADMYRFGYRHVKETGEEEQQTTVRRNSITSFDNERTLFRFYSLNYGLLQTVWRGIYRRDIIRENRLSFTDTRRVFAEDTLFNYQYLLHTGKLVCLRHALYYYRARLGSLTTSTSMRQRLRCCAMLGELACIAAERRGLAYFQEHFHEHYLIILDMVVSSCMRHVPDAWLRSILDDMWSGSAFHRQCIRRIRQYRPATLTGREWYGEDFGRATWHPASRAGEAKKTS